MKFRGAWYLPDNFTPIHFSQGIHHVAIDQQCVAETADRR